MTGFLSRRRCDPVTDAALAAFDQAGIRYTIIDHDRTGTTLRFHIADLVTAAEAIVCDENLRDENRHLIMERDDLRAALMASAAAEVTR